MARVTRINVLLDIVCYLIEHSCYIENVSCLNSVKRMLLASYDGAVDSVMDWQIYLLSQLGLDTNDRRAHIS